MEQDMKLCSLQDEVKILRLHYRSHEMAWRKCAVAEKLRALHVSKELKKEKARCLDEAYKLIVACARAVAV